MSTVGIAASVVPTLFNTFLGVKDLPVTTNTAITSEMVYSIASKV